jgi:hypothetical protein
MRGISFLNQKMTKTYPEVSEEVIFAGLGALQGESLPSD